MTESCQLTVYARLRMTFNHLQQPADEPSYISRRRQPTRSRLSSDGKLNAHVLSDLVAGAFGRRYQFI